MYFFSRDLDRTSTLNTAQIYYSKNRLKVGTYLRPDHNNTKQINLTLIPVDLGETEVAFERNSSSVPKTRDVFRRNISTSRSGQWISVKFDIASKTEETHGVVRLILLENCPLRKTFISRKYLITSRWELILTMR